MYAKNLSFVLVLLSSILFTAVTNTFAEAEHKSPTLLHGYSVQPTNQPMVHLSRSEATEFVTALKSLSNQAHVTFVCEGQPLHLKLSDKEVEATYTTKLESPLPLKEAVDLVANAFDYDVTAPKITTQPAIYLLNKRYTDKDEIPYVTFDEVQNSLEGIITAISPYNNPFENEYTLRQFWLSLSPDQRTECAHGLPVNQLSHEQQEYALRLAGGMLFNARPNLHRVAMRLAGCRKPETIFKWQTKAGLHFPIYEGQFGFRYDPEHPWYVTLNRWFSTQSGGVSTLDNLPEIKWHHSTTIKEGLEVTNGNEEPTNPRPASSIPPPASVVTQTIASVVEDANKQLANGGDEITKAESADGIAEKPVLIVGNSYVSPISLLQAVGNVYGLPVRTSTQTKTIRIILPVAHPIRDAAEIQSEINRLLPKPFTEALDIANKGRVSYFESDALYIAVVRRLRELIEPVLNKRSDGKLPMVQVGKEEHNLVALSSLLTCMDELRQLRKPPAALLLHFTEAKINISSAPENPNSFGVGCFYDPPVPPGKEREEKRRRRDLGYNIGGLMILPETDKPGYLSP